MHLKIKLFELLSAGPKSYLESQDIRSKKISEVKYRQNLGNYLKLFQLFDIKNFIVCK